MVTNIFKKRIKILTHSGRFHADEVFAIAALKKFYTLTGERVKITRSRDEESIDKVDIVVDTGRVYDHLRKKYDHHQKDGAGERDNGVPYASFGLIWKHYGTQICGSEEVSEIIDESLVQPIDAGDIGYDSFKAKNENLHSYPIGAAIASFNPIRGSIENSDKMFLKAVSFASYILDREIKRSKVKSEDAKRVRDTYKSTEDKRILVFDESTSVKATLDDMPEPIYSISPSTTSDEWVVYALPVMSTDPFNQRKKFPKEWRGLDGSKLEEISGIKGAKFCHYKGFLCTTDTKEGALELANKALEM